MCTYMNKIFNYNLLEKLSEKRDMFINCCCNVFCSKYRAYIMLFKYDVPIICISYTGPEECLHNSTGQI